MRNVPVPKHRMLDFLIEKLGAKNDRHLAQLLGSEPPVLSKMRHGKLPFGPGYIIRAHLLTDIPIRQLLDIMDGAGELAEAEAA